MKLLVLNGPNLNLLGRREPEVYGTLTLDELNRAVAAHVHTLNATRTATRTATATSATAADADGQFPSFGGVARSAGVVGDARIGTTAAATATASAPIELAFFQSNHEGLLIDTLQNAPRHYDGIVYNPAAHTHYSIALRDAIAAIPTPVVEVHLSDIAEREEFRHHSVMVDVCHAQFKGKGVQSYIEAVEYLVAYLDTQRDDQQEGSKE